MALIGINPVSSRERKPSTLEQIALGVEIATKVLGTGMQAYKTFGPEADETKARTKLYNAQADKASAESKAGTMPLSDIDKNILESYTKEGYTLTSNKDDGANPIYLPDSKRTIYFKMGKPSTEKLTALESKLRDQFTGDFGVKNFRTIHGSAKSIADSFRGSNLEDGDAARDIALLYNYIRILDPNSAVKEGEIQLSQNASTVAQQFYQQYRRLKDEKGGVLPPQMRKSILNNIAETYQSRLEEYNALADQYRGIADVSGADFERIKVPIIPVDLSFARYRSSTVSPDKMSREQKLQYLKGTP